MTKKTEITFLCPTDGNIDQKYVSFLCNRCGQSKTIRMGNTYVCPECLEPKANLECRICGSSKVVLKIKNKS